MQRVKIALGLALALGAALSLPGGLDASTKKGKAAGKNTGHASSKQDHKTTAKKKTTGHAPVGVVSRPTSTPVGTVAGKTTPGTTVVSGGGRPAATAAVRPPAVNGGTGSTGWHAVNGLVTAVSQNGRDPSVGTITVQAAGNRPVAVRVTGITKYTNAGKPATFSAVQPGRRVHIGIDQSHHAREVDILTGTGSGSGSTTTATRTVSSGGSHTTTAAPGTVVTSGTTAVAGQPTRAPAATAKAQPAGKHTTHTSSKHTSHTGSKHTGHAGGKTGHAGGKKK